MARVQVTRAMYIVFADIFEEILESERNESLRSELTLEALLEIQHLFTLRHDWISVAIRKDRASPCRQTFVKSPLRNMAMKVLIEAMSQENKVSLLRSFVLEKLIRSLFSIIVNKQDNTLRGSWWLEDWRLFLLDAANGDALLNSAYDVVVSAVVILALVYQHLLGQVNGGGCRTYSSGSLDFRDTYISVLLFLGAFVWIWFRDVAPRTWGTIYRRSKEDEHGIVKYIGKYEPRLKPPRERVTAGKSSIFSHLALGGYDNPEDAEIVLEIACFYYGKDGGRLELGDGAYFLIPRMTERERGLVGKEKAKWVSAKAKAVFKDFKTAKAARSEVPEINVGEQAVALDSSLPTEQVPCSPCVNPTPSTDEVPEFLLDDFDNSDLGDLGSNLFYNEFADLGSDLQVAWGDLQPSASDVGFGRGTEDISVSDYTLEEPNCQEGIDAPAPILDRDESNGPDVNSEEGRWVAGVITTPAEESFEREVNQPMSEQLEQPHRLREQELEEEVSELKREKQQLEEKISELRRENEQIPELKRKNEYLNSIVLQVKKAVRLQYPVICRR